MSNVIRRTTACLAIAAGLVAGIGTAAHAGPCVVKDPGLIAGTAWTIVENTGLAC